MNVGRSLTELAIEIDRQAAAKRDFIADTRQMKVTTNGTLKLHVEGVADDFPINDYASRQLGERVGIPAKYFDRMKEEAPELLASNVNHWMAAKPERRMVRTMDGQVRAFLSDRYKPMDNLAVARHFLPVLLDHSLGLNITSCDITERKMYLKFTYPKVKGEVKVGDLVEAGGIVTNSEIGAGSLAVLPFVNRLICLNGAVINDLGQRRYHVGRAAQDQEQAYELYSDATLKADDHAFFLKLKDTLMAVLDQSKFDQILARMREAESKKVTGNPIKAVEVLTNTFQLNAKESSGVLTHLLGDGVGLSAYGLMQALSSVADDSEAGYDRNTELQTMAGQVLTLDPSQWTAISQAI